jgi:hypothetical protein
MQNCGVGHTHPAREKQFHHGGTEGNKHQPRIFADRHGSEEGKKRWRMERTETKRPTRPKEGRMGHHARLGISPTFANTGQMWATRRLDDYASAPATLPDAVSLG